MDYRGVLLVGLISAAGLAGATSACSGEDPGQFTFSERSRGTSGEVTSGGVPGTDGGSRGGGGGEGGATVDAGGEGGAPTGDSVFGTSTFAAGTPGRGAPAKGKPQHNTFPMSDPAGEDCTRANCHQGGWAFAGTLYSNAAGAARVAGAEIRVTGPDGKEFAKTFSDVDGNFWIDFVTPIPANSRVGVRTADGKKKNMSGSIGAGQAGCSQAGTCHGASAGKVYVQ
jgi:hypothetical protein